MNLLFQAAQQARLIRERQELIFWTTCGPSTTFDPKITGVAGTWYFDDGTTLDAASGVEISKTFASEGLHRAVFRPASGGLAAITAIDANSDLLTSVVGLRRCALAGDAWLYFNTALVLDIAELSKSNRPIVTSCPYVYGQLSTINRAAIGIKYPGTAVTGSLADLPATLASFCWLYSCAGVRAASIAHLIAIRDIRIYSNGWLTADVDIVIDSMWAARANYTYATPSLQIGGTNQAPTGNVIAPIEGADWHQDGATWIPLTAGAKIYDLANNVNSEVRPSWAITYTA